MQKKCIFRSFIHFEDSSCFLGELPAQGLRGKNLYLRTVRAELLDEIKRRSHKPLKDTRFDLFLGVMKRQRTDKRCRTLRYTHTYAFWGELLAAENTIIAGEIRLRVKILRQAEGLFHRLHVSDTVERIQSRFVFGRGMDTVYLFYET